MAFLHARQQRFDELALPDLVLARLRQQASLFKGGTRLTLAGVVHETPALPQTLVDRPADRGQPGFVQHDGVDFFRHVSHAQLSALDRHQLGRHRLGLPEGRVAHRDPGLFPGRRAGVRSQAEAHSGKHAELEQAGPHGIPPGMADGKS
ncbi:hypothetical protein [Massilia sp. X63]|uniref:hypothetical protein n=1 Tax=Massilia sp. X63 TaxID=3237285 RepID=UPI0034DD5D7E